MTFWKRHYSVCKQCGVHFEPAIGFHARWGDLCGPHRQPVMERDLRRDKVLLWADLNWEKVEPMALKEEREAMQRQSEYMNSVLSAQAQAQMQAPAYGGLGGFNFNQQKQK